MRRASRRSIPGIFAVGDINDYPGQEEAHPVAAFTRRRSRHLRYASTCSPGEKVHLQYTTTSPLLQKRLGVVAERPEPANDARARSA